MRDPLSNDLSVARKMKSSPPKSAACYGCRNCLYRNLDGSRTNSAEPRHWRQA